MIRSHILDDLNNELDRKRFHSRLLDETVDSESDQNEYAQKSENKEEEAAFTEVLGTSYVLRGSFDIRSELQACDANDQIKRGGSLLSDSSIALH